MERMSQHECKMDLESDLSEWWTHLNDHANACVCGSNFVVLEREDQVMEFSDASPFLDDHEPIMDIPVASCATTWVDPEDRQAHVLVCHQLLLFGTGSIKASCAQIRQGTMEMEWKTPQGNVIQDLHLESQFKCMAGCNHCASL